MAVPNSAIYGILSGNQTFTAPAEPLYTPYSGSVGGVSSFAVANVQELSVSSIVGLGSSNVSMGLDSVTISTCTVLGGIVMTGSNATIGLQDGGAIRTPFSTGTTSANPLVIQATAALNAGGSTIISLAPVQYNAAANYIALANYRDLVLHTAPLTTSTIGVSSFSVLGDANSAISWTTVGYS